MKKFLVSVLAIAGLVACNNEQTIVQQGPAPMEFAGAFVENATRANDPSITTTSLKKFKVWAFVSNESGTVLTDETVSKNGDVWTYDNKQYWTPNNTFYFAAVAPVDGQHWTYKQNVSDQGEDNTIEFTNVDGTEDLLYAYKEVTTPATVDQSMEAVSLQFNHLLSKVRFSFTNGFTTDNVFVAVEDVKMVAHKKGIYAVDGTWTPDGTETVELTFGDATDGTTVDKGGVAALAFGQSANAADERFSIPADENYSYTVTFTIKHYNGDVLVKTYNKESTVSGIALEAGKAYNFAAVITPENLDLESIEFTVDEENGVADWEQVYVIDTADEFKVFANLVNSGTTFEGVDVVLTADIDLNNQEWTPIGSADAAHGFMGNFDGKGHKISNLSIKNIAKDSDGYAYAGLFGVTEGVDADKQNSIKNLVIENVDIDTDGHIVAAAVAYPYYTVVENVTVQGNISIKGGDYTAGILAYTRRCIDVKDLTINANSGSSIEGGKTVGGVVSDLQTNGGLVVNYSNFKASGLTIKGENSVGGISGIIGGQTLNGAVVENVVIDCANHRKGIVAGSLGNPSTIHNVSYNSVTGADKIVGAPFSNEGAVYKNGDDYSVVDAATDSTSLNSAIAAGDDTVYLADGTFVLPNSAQGKTLTFIGTGNPENTVIAINTSGSYEGCDYALDGSTVVFKNISITTNNKTYTGYARCKATFENCIINNCLTLYDNCTFNGCTFNVSGDQYNVWTWGAKTASFKNCTFNSDGKALLYYQEGTNTINVNVEDCVFNDNGGLTDLKAAIEIGDAPYGATPTYNLTVSNTVVNGYEINNNGINTGTTLWANKNSMPAERLNVIVDGVEMY
ncbi:MAG: fimbrillin family protein [Alistipes sp.]|nr:fimbrillin family protein [Alistipes sp.]